MAIVAETVLSCEPAVLQETVAFLSTPPLEFVLLAIFPADAPATAVVQGHGLRLRLQPGDGPAGRLRLLCPDLSTFAGRALTAPNGTELELADAESQLDIPLLQAEFVAAAGATSEGWDVGRAGMQYRDLIPGRQGGYLVGSQIRISTGGPVPDYVHFHRVAFQIIYCYKGWARLVYEGQGEPFVMEAGDCILQPPTIRHQVLESGDGLEVIELGCPAEHETFTEQGYGISTGEPTLSLPITKGGIATGRAARTSHYGGDNGTPVQQFVWHRAALAAWRTAPTLPSFEYQDIGLAAATAGLGSAFVVRQRQPSVEPLADWGCPGGVGVAGGLTFLFILSGTAVLERTGEPACQLGPEDSVTGPVGSSAGRLRSTSADLAYLIVAVADATIAGLGASRL
jgi:quercetin dioxygenase-like cupin family protein